MSALTTDRRRPPADRWPATPPRRHSLAGGRAGDGLPGVGLHLPRRPGDGRRDADPDQHRHPCAGRRSTPGGSASRSGAGLARLRVTRPSSPAAWRSGSCCPSAGRASSPSRRTGRAVRPDRPADRRGTAVGRVPAGRYPATVRRRRSIAGVVLGFAGVAGLIAGQGRCGAPDVGPADRRGREHVVGARVPGSSRGWTLPSDPFTLVVHELLVGGTVLTALGLLRGSTSSPAPTRARRGPRGASWCSSGPSWRSPPTTGCSGPPASRWSRRTPT